MFGGPEATRGRQSRNSPSRRAVRSGLGMVRVLAHEFGTGSASFFLLCRCRSGVRYAHDLGQSLNYFVQQKLYFVGH